MSLLLLFDTPTSAAPPIEPPEELLANRFLYDLIFRGELREDDLACLKVVGANITDSIRQIKIIRITELL
jgi:hypothetical protein